MQSEPSLDDLRILLAVHRHGSFFAAGQALGLATSTIARRVAALEASLGRSLVLRSNLGARVEPEALALVELAEQMTQSFAALRRDSTSSSELRGVVRLSVGEGFVAPLVEVLAVHRLQHPGLEIELVSEARFANLARREADLAIRTARSSSKVLVERPLGQLRFGLFAAGTWVQRHLPAPRVRASDLGRYDFVGYATGDTRRLQERFLVAHGVRRFPFRASSEEGVVACALHGQGIALLADLVGQRAGLVPIAVDLPLPEAPVFLVCHRDLRRVPRIASVAAAITESVRAQLGRYRRA